jgi:hypothetical protein
VQRSCAPSSQRRCRLHTNGSITSVSQVKCPPLVWILNSLFWLFNVCPNPSVTTFRFYSEVWLQKVLLRLYQFCLISSFILFSFLEFMIAQASKSVNSLSLQR